MECQKSFRPLSGHLISKSTKGYVIEVYCLKRFRPLSGHLISKFGTYDNIEDAAKAVSVPSRGILFPNNNMARKRMVTRTMFPSPLGASYFQIYDIASDEIKTVE